ncbi:hypothetical protein FD03_GL001394 [Companilactobacillus nodensis DSM 19682 = JCM 14932 = NBRC 107160]|uniref:Uncharacterized protein n=2 Tax=Companilactobacillus nodensis TaxID=460870 RepID=A0A0R1K6X8_9LACO|nr:hypothetical protein [Companilactobacillus nodensis]KRK79032.1 hypothetical protein FD03_GL001394 [Companilactobacillus nodensis DSM 19682 = JCM 14932 = NBRC 107160]
MDWGNIADWANVLVTAIGFAGAVFSFRESKDSDLGVSLSDAKSQGYKTHGYEVMVTNNSDDHLILENHFDSSENGFKQFCRNSISGKNIKYPYLIDGNFINKRIVKAHEVAELWAFQPYLLDYLSGEDHIIKTTKDNPKEANKERRSVMKANAGKKHPVLRLEFEDMGKNYRYRWYMPKWIRNRYIVMLFLDDNDYVKYEVHFHKFRKSCRRCKNPDREVLADSVFYPDKPASTDNANSVNDKPEAVKIPKSTGKLDDSCLSKQDYEKLNKLKTVKNNRN